MNRTLAISLWLALGAGALAQTAVTPQKNVQVANTVSHPSAPKPSPVSVKVVPVPAKNVTGAKSVVVAAKPAVAQAKSVAVISAKPSQVQVKPSAVASKPVVVGAKPPVVSVQPIQAKAKTQVKPVVVGKTAVVPINHVAVVPPQVHGIGAGKPAPTATRLSTPPKPAVPVAVPAKEARQQVAVKAASVATVAADDKTDAKSSAPVQPEKEKSVAQSGRRDPFVSPIVTMSSLGSGCSSGKRCLAIDQINLRGIVKSDTGMIAVVVNAAEKAYFLRENDPVFNGYVVRITGDSIVFKETFHDKFGKPLTRDITKTISRPVA